MSGYSQDDLIDYSEKDEGIFDEDHSANEEYDKLYELLPQLKKQVAGKYQHLDEKKMKELLWNNYFNVEDTVTEIKDTFKGRNASASDVPRVNGGLSGLLLKRHSKFQPSSGGGLAGLMARKHIKDEESTTGLSKLAMRIKKQRMEGPATVIERMKKVPVKLVPPKVLELPPKKSPEPASPPVRSFSPELPKLPEFSLTAPVHLTSFPSSLLTRVIFFDQLGQASPNLIHERHQLGTKLKTDLDFFRTFTNSHSDIARRVTANFSEPSPDEKQRKLDQMTSEMSKVNLSKKKAPAKPHTTKPKKKIDLQKELSEKSSKPNLSFIVIGHVDSGKSTMIGRLLYDLKIVDSKTMHRLTKESDSIGKSSFSLAWIMDQTPEERSRGVTVDICQTQFETKTSRFTVIDSPGHKDYVPKMINGVTQADIAVMIVDTASFEAGFSNNGQTKEHLTIAKNLGIKRCIIAVNKMDTVDWDVSEFIGVRDQLSAFLIENLKYEADNLIFVPTSGFLGDNVVKKSTNCSWYKGKPLMQLLEEESRGNNRVFDEKSRFIMTINDLQQGSRDDELILGGRINSGFVQPGETILIAPGQESATVDSICVSSSDVGSSILKKSLQNLAIEGEFVELKLKKIDNADNIKIGDLITKIDDPLESVRKLRCEITCFNLDRPLLVGTPFILFRGNVSIPSRFSKIEQIITASGKLNKKRKHLSSDNSGIAEIEILDGEIPIITFKESEKLGRIVIRKDGKTVGAGRVL
ncbi:hypothetical protein FOA43_001318 [Brettanomyces nanus]|uniref:Elongation factor 1 alpha-like protein n=1 Tax=Eeniella nana TaxID=13502 RepID=A0A875RX55_EENNA|nr:uncharacterized protein FOA43_001318 [Brettanomyces nanus]QPG74001.1 hypothetical protein FOA43_001318 [Brettanomyces nanus]